MTEIIIGLTFTVVLIGLAVAFLSRRLRELEHHFIDHIRNLIEHHDENDPDPR